MNERTPKSQSYFTHSYLRVFSNCCHPCVHPILQYGEKGSWFRKFFRHDSKSTITFPRFLHPIVLLWQWKWEKPGQTNELVSVNVKQAYAQNDNQLGMNLKKWRFLNSSAKVIKILAVDVINNNAAGRVGCSSILHCLTECIVHVHLSESAWVTDDRPYSAYWPFTLLEVDNASRTIAAMPQTSWCTETGWITTLVNSRLIIYSMVFIARWSLTAGAVVYGQPTMHSCTLAFFVRGAFS